MQSHHGDFNQKPDGEAAQRQAREKPVSPRPAPDGDEGGDIEYPQSDEEEAGDEEVGEEPTQSLDPHVHEVPVRRRDEQPAAGQTTEDLVAQDDQEDDALPGRLPSGRRGGGHGRW